MIKTILITGASSGIGKAKYIDRQQRRTTANRRLGNRLADALTISYKSISALVPAEEI